MGLVFESGFWVFSGVRGFWRGALRRERREWRGPSVAPSGWAPRLGQPAMIQQPAPPPPPPQPVASVPQAGGQLAGQPLLCAMQHPGAGPLYGNALFRPTPPPARAPRSLPIPGPPFINVSTISTYFYMLCTVIF